MTEHTSQFAFWTDDPALAALAIECGLDCVGPDLECRGKRLRQPEPSALVSDHRIESLDLLARVVPPGRLFARCNPIDESSRSEFASLIEFGVGTIMLPMAKSVADVEQALEFIAGRVRLVVMIEHAALLELIEPLAAMERIHAFYIGTNDLSRSMGLRTRFGPIADGTLAHIVAPLRAAKRSYGFLGLARDDADFAAPPPVSPRLAMAAMVYLGASFFLLARSFNPTLENFAQRFANARAGLDAFARLSPQELAAAYAQFRSQCAAAEEGPHAN